MTSLLLTACFGAIVDVKTIFHCQRGFRLPSQPWYALRLVDLRHAIARSTPARCAGCLKGRLPYPLKPADQLLGGAVTHWTAASFIKVKVDEMTGTISLSLAISSLILGTFSNNATAANYWTGSQKMLSCGKDRLEIVTTCSIGNDSDVHCFKQTITFGNTNADNIVVRQLSCAGLKDRPEMVVSAMCVRAENHDFIVLANANFSNCREGCEWSDYFGSNGKYLGSTVNQSRNTSFKRRGLRKSDLALIRKISSAIQEKQIEDSFDIKRGD